MRRLENDRPSIKAVDRFSLKEILQSVASPHVIIIFIMTFMVGTTTYGLATFLPTIVNQLGFSPSKSQLLSVGPFGAGFFGKCFSKGDISQGLFAACSSSDFNFCILVRSPPIKRYYHCSYLRARCYRVRSLSK